MEKGNVYRDDIDDGELHQVKVKVKVMKNWKKKDVDRNLKS